MRNILLLFIASLFYTTLFSQVEIVPADHSVYEFLKKMDAKGFIPDHTSGISPLSRSEVAGYLSEIKKSDLKEYINIDSPRLNSSDREILNDYLNEFAFETGKYLKGYTENQKKVKWQDREKHLFSYTDSSTSFYFNLNAGLYQKNGWGDSLKNKIFTSGNAGFAFRGTLFSKIGFALSYTSGRVMNGTEAEKDFAERFDPQFSKYSYSIDDGRMFSNMRGYIRYETPTKWLSIMVGKEKITQGFGYIDKLFLSDYAPPFPFINLNIKYKSIKYSFIYGNLKGDSAGVQVPSKMIATHRLDVHFGKKFKAGIWESLISSNNAFSFVNLNPLSFLVSADLNTGPTLQYENNSLLGFDFEFNPVKNIALQGTLLIDDINLKSLWDNTREANDNKFGYQAGLFYTDAFTIQGLLLKTEYTRLDPFVYTHRYNKNQFTNENYSLGHMLSPNSDEIALEMSYYPIKRLRASLLIQFQRSGEGFTYDSLGNIDINYGGDINHGERFYDTIKNVFLQGDRVNRSIFTLNLNYEPIRNYFICLRFIYKYQNLKYKKLTVLDRLIFVNAGLRF